MLSGRLVEPGRLGTVQDDYSSSRMINRPWTSPLVVPIVPYTLPETGQLPSVRWFAECSFSGTRQSRLCRVFFFNTRQRGSLPSVFFYTRQRKFQSIFWSSKLIQMKKFSTTKLYNSSRCTMFVLVFSSYDKVKINLFTNLTYLSCSLWNYKRDI